MHARPWEVKSLMKRKLPELYKDLGLLCWSGCRFGLWGDKNQEGFWGELLAQGCPEEPNLDLEVGEAFLCPSATASGGAGRAGALQGAGSYPFVTAVKEELLAWCLVFVFAVGGFISRGEKKLVYSMEISGRLYSKIIFWKHYQQFKFELWVFSYVLFTDRS